MRRRRTCHARSSSGVRNESQTSQLTNADGPCALDGLSSVSVASDGSNSATGGSAIYGNVNVRLDLNASALSVDATGAVAVLAGRKGLHLVDLDTPFLPPSTLYHQTKLEVTVVKCNPHALFKSHVASSSNRNTLIWDIANAGVNANSSSSVGLYQGSSGTQKHDQEVGGSQTSTQPLVATLRGHTRPVSDIAWSPMEPSLLATSSADAKTLLWDMRSPQRPVQTLNASNISVIQMEWNRVDATTLATAHDGEVRVWDLRASGERTVAPVALITAHMQNIYGLDWNPQRMYELVTCSEDKTVKFWDITQPRVCQGMLTTGAPVWRAQYTPFGEGLVTISQRLDNTIRLWALSHGPGKSGNHEETSSLNNTSSNSGATVTADLVHSFVGHNALIRGMAWRVRPQSNVFQLVSWSKDQELRLWHVDVPQLEACGYDTASYLADGAPSEGNNTSIHQQTDIHHMLRTDVAQMHAQHFKYSLSALKSDFLPLVVPKSAVPLSKDEYTLQGDDSSLQALLALEEELIKGSELHAQSSNSDDDSPVADKFSDDLISATYRGTHSSGAKALPCPRISGAAFSGPNMLLVFDSRVAIGQSRSSVVPTTVAAGKESKPQVPSNKLPRTYEELLDLRDSRFATKKNKKPPVKLLSSTNMMGSMDVGPTDWAGQQQQAQDMIDNGVGIFGEDVETHGYRHATMYYPSGNGGVGGNDDMMNESESSIHTGSEYLSKYFSSAEYHLPVNNPDHLLTMPPSAPPGLQPSPHLTIRNNTTERLNRLEQPTPALNLDLSISVTILDLSKLCGVSSILTYQTELIPRSNIPLALPSKTQMRIKRKMSQIGAVNRSMISWMLQAAEEVPYKRGVVSKNHLAHVLKGLVKENDKAESNRGVDGISELNSCTALAATCVQNARTAALAGRRDLQQIWSLLGISAAPDVELPIYSKSVDSTNLRRLQTSHPWSAHPLGKRLVHKVLDMYEQVGDVQALASIVCALKPSERKGADESHYSVTPSAITMQDQLPVVQEDRRSSTEDVNHILKSTPSDTTSVSNGMRTRHLSSNNLSTEFSDAPPVMKGARRSSSHSEGRSQGLTFDKDATMRAFKDWQGTNIGTNSNASSRHSSPSRDHMRGTNRDGKVPHYGWKMDFERLENPFKTWSGNSGREAPPPRLTADTFQPPIQAVNGKSPAPSMTASASPRIDPMASSPLHESFDGLSKKEEVDVTDRVQLTLSFRSMEDEKCLLSLLPEDEARYDIYKEAYADVLYRYGAMNLRNEVLKTKSYGTHDPRGISIGLVCASCTSKTIDLVCSSCRDFAVRCSVCQLVVRGQSMFCMTCGHGGHTAHLREWFEIETTCPTGCGCWCKQATATMPAYQLEEQQTDDNVSLTRSQSF
ncbi:Conserved WD40 repeat-containing protein [Plasmopara halstedii]|uniref:Conserved WD40 repeat-containing protein n=1 Tax=Plasmopara halstedii TaxID=4781 RepID=A0A0P1AAU5_PLAHL|nr:Conserved WD40 repeat-containing protein [Plasmopara halstedii]CEG37428.1 Conserved WD40 repeat-containing protein [Plasmopara halstedii]|eukprot:XP_024573797.1 Conserved WD40 repeat-containing protein [Plasmopara halstedii]